MENKSCYVINKNIRHTKPENGYPTTIKGPSLGLNPNRLNPNRLNPPNPNGPNNGL